MKPIPVTPKLAVAPQPKLEDFQSLSGKDLRPSSTTGRTAKIRPSPARRPKRKPPARLGSVMSTFP
jgi:hypothetical protein